MNLEGSVKLVSARNGAIADPAQRKARFDEMVAEAYQRGKALSAATLFEIDDVIEPATRVHGSWRIALATARQAAIGRSALLLIMVK